MQENPVPFLGWEDLLEKCRLPTPVFLGFRCGSAGKISACNAEDLGSTSGSVRSPGEWKGYAPQYSGLENFKGQSVTQLSDFHFQNMLYYIVYQVKSLTYNRFSLLFYFPLSIHPFGELTKPKLI